MHSKVNTASSLVFIYTFVSVLVKAAHFGSRKFDYKEIKKQISTPPFGAKIIGNSREVIKKNEAEQKSQQKIGKHYPAAFI